MTYWSGEKLKERVSTCILSEYEVDSGVDCAAYTLHIGNEIFITPDHYEKSPSQNTKKILKDGEPFNIPSGMFAFLLTEEIISVPNDCIAFISMKAKVKFKGLINVSGFHVDPGYKGRLIFSVYNAGPTSIMLKRGMPLFLMWYSDLDRKSKLIKSHPPVEHLDLELLSPIQGSIFSPQTISESVRDYKKDIDDKIHDIDKKMTMLHVLAGIILTFLVGFSLHAFKGYIEPPQKAKSEFGSDVSVNPAGPIEIESHKEAAIKRYPQDQGGLP